MTNEMKTYKELDKIADNVQELLNRVSDMLHENMNDAERNDHNTSVLCHFKVALLTARTDINEALSKFEL